MENGKKETKILCERVQFKNPKSIQFYGWDSRVEHYPFRIIGEDGQPTGYIGVFLPEFCIEHRFLTVIKEDELNDGSYLTKPMGLCANTRIIAALLNIAYPDGKTKEFADFDALEKAIEHKKTVELPTEAESAAIIDRVNIVPFDNYALLKENLGLTATA